MPSGPALHYCPGERIPGIGEVRRLSSHHIYRILVLSFILACRATSDLVPGGKRVDKARSGCTVDSRPGTYGSAHS